VDAEKVYQQQIMADILPAMRRLKAAGRHLF
jgi:hypothetical protein